MTLTITLFALLGIGLVLLMFTQGMARRVDLFSIRNIYLAGFIIYHIVNPILTLRSGNYGSYEIFDPERAGNWLLLFVYVYIAVYLFSYHRVKITRWLANKFSGTQASATDSMLTGLAIGLVVAAIGLRLLGTLVPVLRGLSFNSALALVASACGIMGWVWGQRRFNPMVLMIVAFVMSVALVMSLTDAFSRRPLISVLAGFSWGAYYRWARHVSPGKLIFAIAPLILAAMAIVAAFTAIRGQDSATVQQRFHQMSQGNIREGASGLLSGQTAGVASLWLLDHFPRDFDYQHLFSFRYMAYWWVPRVIWEEKPLPLGNKIASMARLEGVNRNGITLPPGVVSYGSAEGGLYAVVLYALFFGQFTRFFDELIRLNPTNPFVILPVGCTTGNFLGLARGDIANFTNLIVISFLASLLILYLTSQAFGGARRAPAGMPWPQPG